MRLAVLAKIWLLGVSPLWGQFLVPIFDIGPTTFLGCDADREGVMVIGRNGLDADDCTTGSGAAPPHVCVCEGASGIWSRNPNVGYVRIAGDTMTGSLIIEGTPAQLTLGDSSQTNASARFIADSGRNWVAGLAGTANEWQVTEVGSGLAELVVESGGLAKLRKSGTPIVPGSSTLLHLQNNALAADDTFLLITAGTTGESAIHFGDSGDDDIGRIQYRHATDDMVFRTSTDATMILGNEFDSNLIVMDNGAELTQGGVWTDASSRSLKADINDLSLSDAMDTVMGLVPITFSYVRRIDEHHVGFIAEDVPDLVASHNRKGLSPMDIVAVLTRVVQWQQGMIEDLESRIAVIEQRN